MICNNCKNVKHEKCENIVDSEGKPREKDVLGRATWCDCQHKKPVPAPVPVAKEEETAEWPQDSEQDQDDAHGTKKHATAS